MVANPLALIAELTHRCPLHCVYCSNPLQLAGTSEELSTAEWMSVFQQGGKLGMLHAHFTGGEPNSSLPRGLRDFTPISSRQGWA